MRTMLPCLHGKHGGSYAQRTLIMVLSGPKGDERMTISKDVRPQATRTHKKPPSITKVERWMDDGVAEATDGCRVEPDGTCPHGKPSWLIELGYI